MSRADGSALDRKIQRLRATLRRALRNAEQSPHEGHARHVGQLAGKLYRTIEARETWGAHPASPRLRAIQERIERRDASNAENDRFWLVKYLEGFALVPKGEFDPQKHRGINYVVP